MFASVSAHQHFFSNEEGACARGCQFEKIKFTTGQKMYRFKRKALAGGFKLLKSGNHSHKSLWRFITNAR